MQTPNISTRPAVGLTVLKTSEQQLQTLVRDPQSFCAGLTTKSIADNFLNESATIGKLCISSENGEYVVKALLNIMIADMVLFLQVGKNMDDDQIMQTVDLILEDYKSYKPEDFKLCFNRGKKGHYGPLYDRFDGQVIMSWLALYDTERDLEIQHIRSQSNSQLKREEAKPLLPSNPETDNKNEEIFRANIKKLREQLDANKKERSEQSAQRMAAYSSIERNKGPVYDMHQRWLKQFTDLSIKQARWKGIRMVQKYGRWLDASAYLEYKQWQYASYNKRNNN